MKDLINLFATLFVSLSLTAQDTIPWILRSENAVFLAKVDSVFELRFKKQMDLFPIMEAGALNYARCTMEISECSEEYIYNESYIIRCFIF